MLTDDAANAGDRQAKLRGLHLVPLFGHPVARARNSQNSYTNCYSNKPGCLPCKLRHGLLPESTSVKALALASALEHFVIAQHQATWHELETRMARPKFDRYFGESGRLWHLVKIAQSNLKEIRVYQGIEILSPALFLQRFGG